MFHADLASFVGVERSFSDAEKESLMSVFDSPIGDTEERYEERAASASVWADGYGDGDDGFGGAEREKLEGEGEEEQEEEQEQQQQQQESERSGVRAAYGTWKSSASMSSEHDKELIQHMEVNKTQ